jgi:hypothetical protein
MKKKRWQYICSRKTKYYKNMSPKNISFYPRILKNH